MKLRRIAIALFTAALLLSSAVAFWLWRSTPRPYSSPTAIRTNSIYLRAHAEATNAPPFSTNIFASITFEQTASEIRLGFPGSFEPPEHDYLPLTIHHADSNQVARIGAGSLRLEYLATGYSLNAATNENWQTELPANFYNARLEPLSRAEASAAGSTVNYRGGFPTARFFFVASNLPAFKPLRFVAFDARTTHWVTSGHSSSRGGDRFWFESPVHVWHQAPLQLVTTIVTGPAQIHSFALSAGPDFEFPGGAIRVLAALNAGLGGWSSRSDGKTNETVFKIETNSSPRASFLLFVWPRGHNFPGEINFFDANGRQIDSAGASTSGHLIQQTLNGRIEDIKEMRVILYPNTHRLIFTLPELPGLPEQNRGLENLFDVHVPIAHFRYESSFQQTVQQLLQMQMPHIPITYPNNFFPITRTNTTARALFEELASMVSNPNKQLHVDSEENEIELREHPIRAFLNALKRGLGL